MSPQTDSPPVNNILVFFSTCSTRWKDLSAVEKDSCTGLQRLQRQIGGLYYAWPPAGELLKQWNERGYEEYTSVLKRRNEERASRWFPSRKKLIARPLLFLLSETDDRNHVVPYILVSSKDKVVIKETKALFEKHSRLGGFGFDYMAHQSELQFTTYGELNSKSNIKRRNVNSTPRRDVEAENLRSNIGSAEQESTSYPYFSGLSGARIRVVNLDADHSTESTFTMATIGGAYQIGDTHYLLTAAHIFSNGFISTDPRIHSGLCANSGASIPIFDQSKPRKVTGLFAISIETSRWCQARNKNVTEIAMSDVVSISLTHGRYATSPARSRQVMLDFSLDWALIELREHQHWAPTQLHRSLSDVVLLSTTKEDGPPPPGPLLLATGMSGVVKATSLGAIGGLVLPWSRHEIKTWLIECSISIGDSGSLALCPRTGTAYGLVVAHDPDTLLAYIVPIKDIIDRISESQERGTEKEQPGSIAKVVGVPGSWIGLVAFWMRACL